MALRGNNSRFQIAPHRYASGVASVAGGGLYIVDGNWYTTGKLRNFPVGQANVSGQSELAAYPSGYLHPGAWVLPQKAGSIAARNTIMGDGGISSSAQSGFNIDASLSGSGTIDSPSLGLIIQIAATLIASGGISSATTQALASIVATITGSSSVTATAAGLADLGASILGSGLVNANNTALMGLSATIRGYSDLSTEGLRDAVWQAIADNYTDAGTMGALLNALSSGVSPEDIANAVWSKTLP